MPIDWLNDIVVKEIDSRELYYDIDEAVETIMTKTGLSKNVVISVLEAEEDYMISVGIMDEKSPWENYRDK